MQNLFGLSVEQMLGVPTVHIPINLIAQKVSNGKYWGIWQSQHPDVERLLYNSKKTHQLILGDAFIRPHLVVDSNEFRGAGGSHLATHGFAEIDKWGMEPLFKR